MLFWVTKNDVLSAMCLIPGDSGTKPIHISYHRGCVLSVYPHEQPFMAIFKTCGFGSENKEGYTEW